RRLYRARPGGTRVSLPESPAVFGLLALPQKAPAPHGPGEGDDGLLAGVWSPGVSDSPRPQGAGGHLAGPKRQAPPEPDRTLGVPGLRGDSWARHAGTRPHDAQSDRRAPAPAPTLGKAVCLVLSIKCIQIRLSLRNVGSTAQPSCLL